MPEPYDFEVTTDLTPDLLQVIGQYIVLSALLESQLRLCVSSLLRLSEAEARLTLGQPRSAEMVARIKQLLELHSITVKANLDDIQSRTKTHDTHRNDIAHGLWGRHDEKEGLHLLKFSGNWQADQREKVSRRVKPQAVLIDAAAITDLCHSLNQLNQDVLALRDELGAVHDP